MKRLILLLSLYLASPVRAQEPVSFPRDLRPLLKDRCFSCHGALKQKGGLRLDTVAFLKEGGNSGPAIVPGQPAKSLLLERLTHVDPARRMPPIGEAEPLSAVQVARVRAWIAQGAPAPAKEVAEEDPRLHWAFRAPVRAPLPAVKNAAWSRHPVDAFLATEHEKRGLVAQTPASKDVLLRRVYLDLIGLPPTRAELQAFRADTSPDAYEKVVDSLLARPQYGERWARHWMDVWRYSDWYGRRAEADVRNSAPQIWRWRDWIVRSLNDDRGYDRMVQEMLAADEIVPEDDDAQAATGYIVRNWYSLNPHQWMRDMVEHTGKAFLGLTFNCCHCHDHKYDPLSQEEYFRFRAFFEPLGLRQDRLRGEADPGPFQKYEYPGSRKVVTLGIVRAYDEKPEAQTFLYQGGDERLKVPGKPPVKVAAPAFLGGDRLAIAPVSLPATTINPLLKPWFEQDEMAQRETALTAAREALARAMDRSLAQVQVDLAQAQLDAARARFAAENLKHKKQPGDFAALAKAAGQAEGKVKLLLAREKLLKAEQALSAIRKKHADAAEDKDRDAAALALKKVEKAVADAKSAVDVAAKSADSTKYTPSPTYPATSSGRRKALALWITSKDNPLTARVAVNHLWLRHFDRALVETVFDFGRNGKRPSHPALLDYLAAEFMELGWSMNKMHRLLVTSQAYRMASDNDAADQRKIDPDNVYFWHFPTRRLEAEAVRDAILHLSGELDTKLGGPPIENSDEAKSRRRSLYFSIYPEGGGAAPFLEIFDAPDPCDCYKRSSSVVPQQALALINNQLTLNHSRLLVRQLFASDEKAFVRAAFEQVLCRVPSAEEESLCLTFLQRQRDLFRQEATKIASPTGTVPAASDPGMRARESLVRVLFNHNDFVTVR